MTYTRAVGIVFGAAIDRIVRWLALSRIHPNVLTFLGLPLGGRGSHRRRPVRHGGWARRPRN
jgi:hypothetical protein